MILDLAARLRALADALPAGGSVTFTRADLVELVEECGQVVESTAGGSGADYTVHTLAAELGRSGSTVRGWLAEGAFPHSYRLQGREWRIPRADVRAWIEGQKTSAPVNDQRPTTSIPPDDDLGSWRKRAPTRKAG